MTNKITKSVHSMGLSFKMQGCRVKEAYANGVDGYADPTPGYGLSVRYALVLALVLAEAAVHFGFDMLFGVAVSLLDAPYQLVTLAGYFVEVVIGEIPPPF